MKIFKLNKSRRGFTLVELCIVMALMSIAALLMISFTSAFQVNIVRNQARHDFLDQVSNVRDGIQNWISNYDGMTETGAVRNIQVNGSVLSTDGGLAMVALANGEFCIKYPETTVRIPADRIKSVTYEVYDNKRILKCTFTGTDNFGKEFSQTMLFSLASDKSAFIPGS